MIQGRVLGVAWVLVLLLALAALGAEGGEAGYSASFGDGKEIKAEFLAWEPERGFVFQTGDGLLRSLAASDIDGVEARDQGPPRPGSFRYARQSLSLGAFSLNLPFFEVIRIVSLEYQRLLTARWSSDFQAAFLLLSPGVWDRPLLPGALGGLGLRWHFLSRGLDGMYLRFGLLAGTMPGVLYAEGGIGWQLVTISGFSLDMRLSGLLHPMGPAGFSLELLKVGWAW